VKKSRLCRVSFNMYDVLKKLSKKNNLSIVEVSELLAVDIKHYNMNVDRERGITINILDFVNPFSKARNVKRSRVKKKV